MTIANEVVAAKRKAMKNLLAAEDRRSRRPRTKDIDMGGVLKGISTLRKALIDCDMQSKLSVDNLEDVKFFGNTSFDAAQQMSPGLEEAIQCVRGISECIAKAVELSETAKRAIRGEDPTQPVNPSEVVGKTATGFAGKRKAVTPNSNIMFKRTLTKRMERRIRNDE